MGTIGIGVGHDYIRAVLVRKNKIVWRDQATWDTEASLADGLSTLLARAPLRRLRKTRVHVAIGAFGSQVKLLSGLPAIADTGALAAAVRESAASFFLRNGNDLVTTGVRPVGEGQVWAAAFELPTIEAIRVGCRTRRVKLRSITPTAVVLPLVSQNDVFTWRDGPVSLEIARSGTALKSVRRVPTDLISSDYAALHPIDSITSLGPESWRFADAYGATLVDTRSPLSLGAAGERPLSMSAPNRRLSAAVMVGCLGLTSFALSPLGSEWAAHRARATLEERRSGEAWSTMVASASQLERITAVLNEIEAFVAARPGRTRLLGDLTASLPEHSAVVRFQVSGSQGTLEVVTSDAGSLVESLHKLAILASVEVVAQGARQYAGGLDLERITIRFQILEAPEEMVDSTVSDAIP